MSSHRVLRRAAVGLAGAVVALAPLGAAAASAHPAPSGCSLGSSAITTTSSPAPIGAALDAYGDTGTGWTGADSTYSLPLSGGREGWFFSDTFLGPVNADGSRPTTAPFVNNSIVVQRGAHFSTVTGGTSAAPTAIVPPEADGSWYWIGDPANGRHGTVQVPLLQFHKTGTGSFDFAWQANRLAVLDGATLRLRGIRDLPSATGINWGSWTRTDGSSTYVYGVGDVNGVRSSYVALVTGGDGLVGHWRFWDGSRWSPSESSATPIASNVANEYSVTRYRDGYLLVTNDTSQLFGNRVVAQISCSPTGPFHTAGSLFTEPETGALGSYGNANVFSYNAHAHPEFTVGDHLLVSYNVNSFDNVHDVYDDVTIYRPRFLDVTLSVAPGNSGGGPSR